MSTEMGFNKEVSEFLTSRRAKLSPQVAGIVSDGNDRRVAGLRREEVADLAGMSVGYYKRLERGDLRSASEAVVEALCEALLLDEAECIHLGNLAKGARQTIRARSRPVQHADLDSAVEQLLDRITVPAVVWNEVFDIVGTNRLGRALFAVYFDHSEPANTARQLFLNPRVRQYWVDWESAARSMAALVRMQLGRHPHDPILRQLIEDLMAGSADFRRIWALHEVGIHRSGTRRIRHPVVGDIEATCQTLQLNTSAGLLNVATFCVRHGSRSEDAVKSLDSDGPARP